MKNTVTCIIFLLVSVGNSQNSLSKLLKKHNTEQVPYASVTEVDTTNTLFLDAREPQEFEVSHLNNAICVGYDHFNLNQVNEQIPNKDQVIVVYCSLGIRSEVVAQKLIDAGYTNVKNLYGGIFEWKNTNRSVYNSNEIETDSVHTFSKAWSKWLKKGIKVYE